VSCNGTADDAICKCDGNRRGSAGECANVANGNGSLRSECKSCAAGRVNGTSTLITHKCVAICSGGDVKRVAACCQQWSCEVDSNAVGFSIGIAANRHSSGDRHCGRTCQCEVASICRNR